MIGGLLELLIDSEAIIQLIIAAFIGIEYDRLAKRFDKNTWLCAAAGIATYYLSYALLFKIMSPSDWAYSSHLIAIALTIVLCLSLKKTWKNEAENENEA